MGKQSRRLIVDEVENDLPQGYAYCRKCRKTKTEVKFGKATDLELDSNGCLSVCKDCIDKLYEKYLISEGSIQKAVLRLCKKLNIKYDESAIQAAQTHIETKGSDPTRFFGLYRAKLLVVNRTDVTDTLVDLTYQENIILQQDTASLNEVDQEVIDFWGENYSMEEYQWLETMLDRYKKTHKCDTMAEESLLQKIVYKEFDIRKARNEGKSSDALTKQLQDLMKTASVDPAKANSASSDKNKDTYSSFIKMIEENEPAEIFGPEREAFKDFQGIEKYFYNYVTRPLKNFITTSRDFNVNSEDDSDEFEDLDNMELVIPETEDIVETPLLPPKQTEE